MIFHIKEKSDMGYYTTEPMSVYNEFKTLAEADQECLWILGMSTKNRVKIKEMVSLGGLDSCLIYPRVIVKRLLLTDCSSVIIVHNHPSGVPDPSNDDVRLTTAIKDACKLMDIKLLDHIIVGDQTYFSFREKNLI